MSSIKLTRRELIFKSLAAGGAQALMNNPVAQLAEILVTGLVQKAQAQSAGVVPRKYLFIPLMGGSPRWTFTPLSPDPTDLSKMINNPMVKTRFTSATEMSYTTITNGGIAWPWIWQFNVARAGGGTRPMMDLASNMLIMRGILARSDHGLGQKARYFPESIPYSFGSLVSDASNKPIPAVNIEIKGDSFGHVSQKGKSAVRLPDPGNGANILQLLLDGLTLAPRNFHSVSNGAVAKAIIQSINQKLSAQALEESSGFGVSEQSLKDARETFKLGFANLNTVYTNLVNKYVDICQRTVNQTLVGINDQPIGAAPAARGAAYNTVDGSPGFIARNPDMRTLITSNTRVRNLAQNFALAEYVFSNNLSDFVVMGINLVSGLNILRSDGSSYPVVGFDEHNLGSIPSLLVNSFSNLCFAGCILELIDRLKALNLFQNTMIDFSGEMGRNPRQDSGGSDHGGQALDVAMWSGALATAPKIIGNVLAQPPPSYNYGGSSVSTYPGSWGFGAPNPGAGILTIGHLAATQAHILRVPNPVRSVDSLLTENAGVFNPTLPMGRIV